MTGPADDSGTMTYTAQEVVGVFASAGALETAVGELELAGVSRAALSVLGVDTARSGRIAELYHAAAATMDDPSARRAAFVSRQTRVEGEVLAIAVPLEIGGFAGAWAVAAAGGALITAIGATLAGGAVGAGLGVLLFQAVARRHAAKVETQLAQGGLILWVGTPDPSSQARALEVLTRCGGLSVHAHAITRHWGVADTPFHDAQPDPFLSRDPV